MFHWIVNAHLTSNITLNFVEYVMWIKVFKNGPSKTCGRHPLKNWKWYGHFKFFKGCPSLILLVLFLNTLTYITVCYIFMGFFAIFFPYGRSHSLPNVRHHLRKVFSRNSIVCLENTWGKNFRNNSTAHVFDKYSHRAYSMGTWYGATWYLLIKQ